MNYQPSYAQVSGARLYYEEAGSGFPVILLHGLGADTRIWDYQFEPFAQSYCVIRYDSRGFGKSDVPTNAAYTHPDDLKSLLDHLNIAQAHLIGQSMGGEIAIEFALAYPDAVRSLVLVDPALGGYQWSSEYNQSWGAVGAAVAQAGFKGAIDALMAHPLHIPISEQGEAAAKLRAILADYSGWHLAHADPWRRPEPPAIEQLKRVNAPTLIVIGERDLPDFHKIADLLARHIPNVRKISIPGVGHVVPLEAPHQLNEIALNFLTGLSA